MKRAIGLAFAAMFSISAQAADLRPGSVPYMSHGMFAAYNWSGPYIGANLGYEFGNLSGIMGGGQIGYNFQYNQFVFGADADLQASNADETFAAYKFSNPWFGTMRGRFGMAFNNVMLFATAGLAYGAGEVEIGALAETRTSFGWTVGLGIEVGFTPQWTAKAEYLYIDLADKGYVLSGTSHGVESSIVRMGVNYRF